MSEEHQQPSSQEPKRATTSEARPDVTVRVMDYFHQNRSAMDSVDGISRFWVGEDRTVVERCLVELHTQGLLRKRTIAGTDFYSLQKDAVGLQPAQRRPSAATAVLQAEARGRVLIVDDEPTILRFMVEILSEAGHSVVTAEGGYQAIERIRTDPFDVVITDVLMPGISGIKVLEAVKEHRPSTEVIVLTGHASLETAIKALRHGAYDFITKPLDDLETLPRVVELALERKRLSTENQFLVEKIQARNLELKQTVTRLASVNEISRAMLRLLDLSKLYEMLVQLVAQHLKARRVSVLVAEPDSDTLILAASVGIIDEEALKQTVRVGEGIAGRVAASQSPVLVPDIETSDLKGLQTGGRYITSSFMISPLTVSYPTDHQRRHVGVINVSDKHSGDPFTEQDLEFLSMLAFQVEVAIENAHLVKEMEAGYLTVLAGLIQAVEDARPQARGHSRRVAEVAVAVAREMGLAEPRVEVLAQATALHSVGRVSAWLEKADRMMDSQGAKDEWGPDAVMAAERVLAPIASLRPAREIILRSAEYFDEAPMPFGVKRPVVPLESRVLGICEEFVRLAPASAQDPEQACTALQAIQGGVGMKHDPGVVAALKRVLEKQAPP